MEKLFTQKQIQHIQQEADANLDTYLDGWLLDGNATEISIITISKGTQLIFTEGNDDTGYRHLSDRHSYFSRKHYWRTNENNEFKLENPSKFFPGFIPIKDYVKIADEIFKVENKNITTNHKPDLFDKYTGSYAHDQQDTEKYHLLTYRDTKIVHTLFPDKKKHNPKYKCVLARGPVTESVLFPEGFNDLYIPFLDHNQTARYSITIRRYYGQLPEHLIISEHDIKGEVCLQYLMGERELEVFKRFDRDDMHDLQHADLSELEQIINEMYNELSLTLKSNY